MGLELGFGTDALSNLGSSPPSLPKPPHWASVSPSVKQGGWAWHDCDSFHDAVDTDEVSEQSPRQTLEATSSCTVTA